MKKITYQAALKDLILLVPTEEYSNPELAQSLIESGVNEPIIFSTDGTKSRFGMKKLNVKDGLKRLNLAASNPEIAELVAQVVLVEDSITELMPLTTTTSGKKTTEVHLDQKTY
ncbi:MAG: hypothetical protein RLZZ574_427, partial [Cyanobacteriota bacterium]